MKFNNCGRYIMIVVAVFYLMLPESLSMAEGPVNPDSISRGIFSKDRVEHQRISARLVVAETWIMINSEEHLYCKWVNERVLMENLEGIIGFKDQDLIPMTDDRRSDYDESSIYFESCNYVGGYHPPIFDWGIDRNILLKWPETDAYIDTEHSLLLVKYVDRDQGYVRALFIDKKHQLISNEMSKDSIFEKFFKRKH